MDHNLFLSSSLQLKCSRLILVFAVSILFSCQQGQENKIQENSLFALMPSTSTGIAFSNNVTYTEELNAYTFRNFYNGSGVGIADINNDSLPDLFFCSNMKSNKLYLNKGNFKFEDITDKAGLNSEGIWSTGVTFADINADGLIDIYVCKSGDIKVKNRANALYINNGDLTFTDKAKEYGLNNMGLSTHAVFFDFDNDNDLDCYLLNNSFKSVGNFDLVKDQRKIIDSLGGNKLYRNDNNFFKDITIGAGIYSSKIGFGLGVTIADINKDGWQDIYVSNDFFERDYLYINNRNGTYKEMLEDCITEMSMNSMGADIADINNDGFPDIYVTDMLPGLEARVKTKTNFENWDKYQSNLKNDYGHQFVRNVLQLNRGYNPDQKKHFKEVDFSEIGRLAGVHATDWSWGALITDLNNDGFKDIFVANGIFKDLTDQDYIQYTANPVAIRKILKEEKEGIKKLIDLMPSNGLSNYAYRNNGDLTFSNKAEEWGLDALGFSNGSAYGDLDNDGDLDLVVNNVNMPAFVYRNGSVEQHPENKFLKVSLQGKGGNRYGIGASVTVHYDQKIVYQESMPMRGFESTVDNRLNFGLGKTQKIDSVVVRWNDGSVQVVVGVSPNTMITVKQSEAGMKPEAVVEGKVKTLLQWSSDTYGIDFVHKENEFVDFDRDKLIYHMLSTEGPRMCKGDVNGDRLEDFYICGAKDQAGVLYIQQAGGRFKRSNEGLLEQDRGSEDTDGTFFDADGDGDEDLFVCSGGSEFSVNSTALISRLYINDGRGKFSKSPQLLPSAEVFESASCVSAGDYDGDGDQDLFVGVRSKPFGYGYACKGYILQNDGKGFFKEVTSSVSKELLEAGMITDGKWLDYDKDGKPDLVLTGEYMPIRLLHNDGGVLKEVTGQAGLGQSHGWWKRIELGDVNGDGYIDMIVGNHGLNSRFHASKSEPVEMYVSDFDQNGTVEQVLTCYNGGKPYPMALRHDLVEVLPYLKKKYLKYENYKEQGIGDIFTKDQLSKALKLQAYELRSCVLLNNKQGGFTLQPLPVEAQVSTVQGISIRDYDGDGKMDVLLGGNFYESKPEVGIYDASYGLLLKGKGNGTFTSVPAQQSGFFVKGAIRNILFIKCSNKNLIVVAKNNSIIDIFQ